MLEKCVLKVHVDATLIPKDSMQIVVQPFYMMHTSTCVWCNIFCSEFLSHSDGSHGYVIA